MMNDEIKLAAPFHLSLFIIFLKIPRDLFESALSNDIRAVLKRFKKRLQKVFLSLHENEWWKYEKQSFKKRVHSD